MCTNNIDLPILYLIFAVSLLGAGFLEAIYEKNLFYGLICMLNIIAWAMALLIDDDK